MIAWFTRNGVAANLLMLGIVVAGLFTLARGGIPIEVFPEFEVNEVTVRVPYRGATPEEVEESVVTRIEEAIVDVQGIEKMISVASQGSGSVTIEIDDSYNRREVLDDVKNKIDAISTFPADTEKPVISLADSWRSVISVVLYGNLSERDLRRLGERVRDDLANLPDVTSVELQGVRPYEISIEVDEKTLHRYGLTFEEIAAALRNSSIDVSAGTLKSEAGEVSLRTKGRAYTGEKFEEIVILTRDDGTRLTVGDIAKVNDGFDENPFMARFNNQRCVVLMVSREGNQNAIEIARQVKDYMEKQRPRLPPGVGIDYWSDMSKIVQGRLDTLYDSASKSVILVFLVLTLFLRPSLAVWVVVGIPVCFLGAIACMPALGVTINVVSLFGFILVLGVVVDDAIVTGENIYTHQRQGVPPHEAAISGAREVSLPVVFGVLTTILAFVPLLFGEGFQGKADRHIALIVIPVLFVSLVESKLILPSHLCHNLRADIERILAFLVPSPRFLQGVGRAYGAFSRFQQGVAGSLEWFVRKIYQPALKVVLHYRYTALAVFLGMLAILVGRVASGKIAYIPFPRVQSERATATLQMQEGTPYEVTEREVLRIQAIAEEMRREHVGEDGIAVIENILSSVGGMGLSSSRSRGPEGQSHLGEVSFYVVPPEERSLEIDTKSLVDEWRRRIGSVLGAKELSFRAEIGRGGDPIDLEITGPEIDDLVEVSGQVKKHLSGYQGLFDISDNVDDTNAEVQLTIKPEAEQFGLTGADLARQVRQAFYGEEIQRIQRGRDELRVMLRYPESKRRSLASLESMHIRTPDGSVVPFSSVAQARNAKSFPRIQRIDRNRAINVTADADKENTDMPSIQRSVAAFMDDLVAKYPGMNYSFQGEAKDERENNAATAAGIVLILCGIYTMLAIPFRSYIQPLIVMSVIPFGVIGAILGHEIEGLSISRMSIFGVLALAGVVVNDSLVLVDYINKCVRKGMPVFEAAFTSGGARFRAIILTSFTTFAGLYPLITLKSTQAQFLIPMAVSLGYGVLFATFITLFLVPVSVLILEDLKKLLLLAAPDSGAASGDKKPLSV